MEGWVKKMWYIHTMDCYSAIQNGNKMMPFAAARMDLEIAMLNEVRQGEYYTISLIRGIKNMVQMNPFTKQ